MSRKPVMQRGAWSRPALAAVVAVAVAALTVNSAFAGPPTLQIEDFYYPDGTPVLSDGGCRSSMRPLPYSDQQKGRIMWQLMTQGLTPGARYDIWIEGSDDGTERGRSAGGSAARGPPPEATSTRSGSSTPGAAGGIHRPVHESGRPAPPGDHGHRRG